MARCLIRASSRHLPRDADELVGDIEQDLAGGRQYEPMTAGWSFAVRFRSSTWRRKASWKISTAETLNQPLRPSPMSRGRGVGTMRPSGAIRLRRVPNG